MINSIKNMNESSSSSYREWWLWSAMSIGQLLWGIRLYKRGHSGDHSLMPIKAFAVASLFVGSAASASITALQASGIHQVKDLMDVGANIRTKLGIPPRVAVREGKADDT